ncbi:MAG TPA: hypothetical protein VFR11_12415 [Micromonosporaceae bacterium]|nr:hypothetical protein [Micromonosporaceae bacterium]
MIRWLRARNGWSLVLLLWGVTLVDALAGIAAEPLFAQSSTSFTAKLPWAVGGSLFVAIAGSLGGLVRRRRQSATSAKSEAMP